MVGAAAACKVYPDSLLDADPVAEQDAGTGIVEGLEAGTGIGWWSGKAENGCVTAGQPSDDMRPAASDAPTIEPIYFGITRLLLGSQTQAGELNKDAWQEYGFDLDGICSLSPTCSDETEAVSCKGASSAVAYDGNYCRDNTFGRFEYFVTTIPEIGKKYELNDDIFNCGLCVGQYNILIKLSGYNGEANDDSVRIDLYASPGLEEQLPFDCKSDNQSTKLCWLDAAPWLIDEDSMDAPVEGPELADAKLFDGAAFVRDHYLFAHFPEQAMLRFPDQNAQFHPFPLRITKGIVTARVEKAADGTWALADGTIAGRVKGEDIVTGFREIGFCETDMRYGIMTGYVKANLDIMSSGEVAPDQSCDAISMGVGFTAQQATAGKLVKVPPLVECPAGAAGAGGSG
jgi:hypothetical protein